MTFDTAMRELVEEHGGESPIEVDPIGAGMRIFFDPSPETIYEMMGLDRW